MQLDHSRKNETRMDGEQSETAPEFRVNHESLKYGKPWGLTTSYRRLNGYTYFIGGDSGCIKIGWTGHSAEQRCKDLQCGSPVKLRVLAYVRGGMSLEREYHQRFKEHRSHGEWFERVPEIEAEIERLTPP